MTGDPEVKSPDAQEVCCYIAHNDAVRVDVAVLLEKEVEILQLRERLWDTEEGPIIPG